MNARVEAADRGEGIRLEDFASGTSRANFVKDYLRPSSDFTINLPQSELQLIGLLNFMITLREDQLFELQELQLIGIEVQESSFISHSTSFDDGSTEPKTLRLPYLSSLFMQSLDETQIWLMNLAWFPFSNFASLLELRDPL